jgi:hypothetical protein
MIRSIRRGEQCSTTDNARRLRDDSDEWHRRTLGKRVLSTTMIRQFQYPKVTPVRPGSGGAQKPAGSSPSGSARRTV